MVLFAKLNGDVHFFCFRFELLFLDIFGAKNQNGRFTLKFGSQTTCLCRIQWRFSPFLFFAPEIPILGPNSVQKIKIAFLFNGKLVPKLIRICRIQWACSFFLL